MMKSILKLITLAALASPIASAGAADNARIRHAEMLFEDWTEQAVCYAATFVLNQQVAWFGNEEENDRWDYATSLAKKRGYNCDVGTKKIDTIICLSATFASADGIIWSSNSDAKDAKNAALFKGLDCGVEDKGKIYQSAETKRQKVIETGLECDLLSKFNCPKGITIPNIIALDDAEDWELHNYGRSLGSDLVRYGEPAKYPAQITDKKYVLWDDRSLYAKCGDKPKNWAEYKCNVGASQFMDALAGDDNSPILAEEIGPGVQEKPREVLPKVPRDSPSLADKDEPNVEVKPNTSEPEIMSASSGSGFAVATDGYLVTNNHVIDGCQKIFVHRRGKKYEADIVSFDQRNDLALLKGNFQPDIVLPLTTAKPQLAQDIYVSGYPFGLNISSSVKVTKGIISSLTGIGNNLAEMQIDAALQSGNSGGPILDEYGNVVGVAVAKLDVKFALENFGAIPENTNFGVKANIVEALLDANGVNYQHGKAEKPSGAEFSNMLSNGTYYISCWMTLAQIEAMKTKKVMFGDLQ